MIKAFGFGLLALLFTACTPGVGYEAGVYTEHIHGTIKVTGQQAPFILVLTEEETFLSQPGQPVYRTKARIARVNKKGEYVVTLSNAARSVQLHSLAQGHQLDQKEFARTLGVKAYEYNITLNPSKNWGQEFTLHLKPFLMGFILDDRYQMPQGDQLFLGDWMQEMEKEITIP